MSIIGRVGILFAGIRLVNSVIAPLSIVFSNQLNVALLLAGLVPLAGGASLLLYDPGVVGVRWRTIAGQVARTRTRIGIELACIGTLLAGVMGALGVQLGKTSGQFGIYPVMGGAMLLAGATLILTDRARV